MSRLRTESNYLKNRTLNECVVKYDGNDLLSDADEDKQMAGNFDSDE